MTEADFLEGFKQRDDACSKVVLTWIRDAVARLHWTFSLSREDLVSDASMKLLKVVSEANSTPITSPKGLVRYVVKCTAIDALRRERRVHAMKEKVRHRFPTTPNPEEILISGEELELYLRVRASAEEPCRELWNLLLYEELTYKEIAQRLHISEGALRVRHKRCKDKAAAWIQKNK